ncbi:MAG: hypothetical protein ACJAS1_003978 [Oleiphilaceae bacterium]|jgi:hypothetical protein
MGAAVLDIVLDSIFLVFMRIEITIVHEGWLSEGLSCLVAISLSLDSLFSIL